uniref:ABC transporter ATP-binding protein n=1 Tax=Thermosporothrix sp. COM3 TaxID=2490863 RepID=A0A455SDK5_9CHLR|nr:ABC transporter ATP-binding protein [Thermosporothrix sp. COM3]
MLAVEDLEVAYEKYTVFSHLNLNVEPGSITGIIGPNGCGKSTLLKTMGRILKQSQGLVYLDGKALQTMQSKEIAKRLAILPQSPSAPLELTIEELVAYGRHPHRGRFQRQTTRDRQVIEWAMETAGVLPFREREIGSLSGGQRQKVWLALALAQETDILLLDEPTTYLDIAHQLDVLYTIQKLNREEKRTILMVLHDINHAARFCDAIIAMKEGSIIASGSPVDVITPEVLRETFQVEAHVVIEEQVPICLKFEPLRKPVSEPVGSK